MGLAYFAFYTKDWVADTRLLSLEERGAYVDLLSHMWNAKGGVCALPDDDRVLALVLGIRIDVWRRLRAGLAAVLVFDGRLVYSERQRKEWVKSKEKHDRAVENQKKSEESRKKVALKSEESRKKEAEKSDFFDGKSAGKNENDSSSAVANQNHKQKHKQKKLFGEPTAVQNAGELPPAVSDYTVFVREFFRLYGDVHGGAKPTWGDGPGAIVKTLLSKQPLSTLLARLTVFYGDGCPDWIARGGRDLKAFVGNLDKLAMPSAAEPLNRTKAQTDMLSARAARLEAEDRAANDPDPPQLMAGSSRIPSDSEPRRSTTRPA